MINKNKNVTTNRPHLYSNTVNYGTNIVLDVSLGTTHRVFTVIDATRRPFIITLHV